MNLRQLARYMLFGRLPPDKYSLPMMGMLRIASMGITLRGDDHASSAGKQRQVFVFAQLYKFAWVHLADKAILNVHFYADQCRYEPSLWPSDPITNPCAFAKKRKV